MKKVLIITYYWPPAGGPGVQRWLKFVKYLPDFEIYPVIYAPKNPHYPIQDQSFLDEVSESVTILRQPVFEPYRWAAAFAGKRKTDQISRGIIPSRKSSFSEKILLWIRGNLFIPDARKFWVKPSVKFLLRYIKKAEIDTIITTGPPHSLHLIGLQLKNSIGIKWLVDFRDPWTTIGYHSKLRLSTYAINKHKSLEKKVLQSADRIVVTSSGTKKEFQRLTQVPISIITNGYDEASAKTEKLSEKFTISHIGSLLSDRNPEILWEVLSELIKENTSFSAHFELQLAGTVSDHVLASIYQHGLKNHTILSGYLEHDKALAFQRRAQVLLLIEINNAVNRCIIPGKLFEYMNAQRPILAIGPEDWDVTAIITETRTGSCFTYDEKAAIKQKINAYFTSYSTGKLTTQGVSLAQYSRKRLTQKLAEQIKHI